MDLEDLEDNYEEWFQVFEEMIGELKAQGIKLYKIDVYIQELIKLCEEKGLPNKGEARGQFIARLATKHRGVEL